MAQENNIAALDTLTILVTGINSSLVLVLSWGFFDNKKNISRINFKFSSCS